MRRFSKISYCNSCMRNIPHVRRIQNPLLWWLDVFTLRMARLFRFGPWFCVQCNQREFILPSRRRNAPTFVPDKSQETEFELSQNYIRTTESLIMRRNRASRYSRKYRDGVVQRIISGSHTISQIGQELNLSERDIVDWIADALAQKQERIDELDAILKSVQKANADQVRIGHDTDSWGEDDSIVEGNYRSR